MDPNRIPPLGEALSEKAEGTDPEGPPARGGKGFPAQGAIPFYLLLILSADVCLFIPPLRFIGALALIAFLPGYFLVERLTLFSQPLHAAIGSVFLSLLLSPLISFPGCLLFHKVTPFLIALSQNLFLLAMAYTLKGKGKVHYPEKPPALLAPTLILICTWVFFYLDLTGIGPYSEDWTYLFGILKETSRAMPPRDPEASFLPLRYPWGFYFLYGLLHRLGGLSAWKVLEFVPVINTFSFLGLIYLILVQTTLRPAVGFWGLLLFTVGIQSEWILRGFLGYGFDPGFNFNLHWEEAQALTGYTFLWGWYLLPALLPPLSAFYFLIRYLQEKRKGDLFIALGACSLGPFFHPVYYLGFLAGFSLWLIFLGLKGERDFRLLAFYGTVIPYALTFYLYFKPDAPAMPVYQWVLDAAGLQTALWDFFRINGLVLPFALWAVFSSSEARRWFFPFALLFTLLSILGRGPVNHASHVLFQTRVYLTLLSAVGLGLLRKFPFGLRTALGGLFILFLMLPFPYQVAHKIKSGWAGAADASQKTAGAFIRLNTEEDSIFLILPDSRYSMVCVEGYGERRLIWGWFYHLNRYVQIQTLTDIREQILRFFRTTDPHYRTTFLKTYRPNYLFWGPEERHYLLKHQVPLDEFLEGFQPVYQSETIRIYKLPPQ